MKIIINKKQINNFLKISQLHGVIFNIFMKADIKNLKNNFVKAKIFMKKIN